MRLAGLASGMDIDSMVKEMMKARRASADKLFQQRTTMEWQQENYREISTKIVDFRNNKLSNYSLSNAIGAKTVEISGNTNAVSLSTVTSSASGSLDINVDHVATASYVVFSFDPNGTYDPSDDSTTTGTTGDTLADLGFGASGTIKVNGQPISYSGTETLSELASRINSNKAANATATYNAATGQFSIVNKTTGDSPVVVENFSADFHEDPTAGTKAKVKVNGITYEQDSNRFSINGIDFTAKQVSGTNGTTTMTTVTDTNKIVDTLKSFINDYNNLLDLINGELSEKRNRSYTPLTDEQMEAMTEKQIELWEEKARSGLLRNDAVLSNLASNLRIASISEYSPKFSISAIGIETGTWESKGKLVIKDEAKLRAAIEDDPQAVIDLFTKSKTGAISKPDEAGVGIFKKMEHYTLEALKQLQEKAGTSMYSTDLKGDFLESSLLSTQIRDMKTREDNLASRLLDMENRYYKQFTAMESAINKFNAQSSSLMGFFSS